MCECVSSLPGGSGQPLPLRRPPVGVRCQEKTPHRPGACPPAGASPRPAAGVAGGAPRCTPRARAAPAR